MDPSEFPTRMPESPTVGTSSAAAPVRLPTAANLAAILQPGAVLGSRYEIQQMLGVGGMGAVYKARDTLLDRVVALKVIRPDLASDPQAVQRFKQEIILARQITHRNVVRVFDIAEADGLMFITMEFIEGADLRNLVADRGKLPPQEAVEIMWQVCCGLQAAHAEGVVHRDLKPGNIMRDGSGRIVVMDFGLARSLQIDKGMTQSGAMLGTMEYMSPEQARGAVTDARSDIFTVGLILYELLSGKMPYAAETAIASLVMRTQTNAPPVSDLDANIPRLLSQIVSKCLERSVEKRYQTAQEVASELEAFRERPSGNFAEQYKLRQAMLKSRRMMFGSVAAIIVLAMIAAVYAIRHKTPGPAAHQETTVVLVSDFKNQTADDVFDGTLEPAFSLAMEGASFVNVYPRNQARKIGQEIHPNAAAVDEELARLIAIREGIGLVISGSVAKEDDRYRLSVRVLDPKGKVIATGDSDRVSKDKVLQEVSRVAAKLRTALGDTTAESSQSASETYTAGSLEAAHDYALAQELRYSGKSDEAIRGFKKAIELDPGFGSAYAGLAAMYANQGQREAATDNYKLAMSHSDRMTEREKLRTRGGYYLANMDAAKAIEEFSTLVQKFPADTMGHSSLAFAYYLKRDMPKAMEEGQKAVDIYPKYVPYRNNVALYSLYSGEFEKSEKIAAGVLQDNPNYLKAYVTLALSQLATGQRDSAIASYEKLQKVSALGASFAVTGLADLALYEGRTSDAAGILEKGIAADDAAKNEVASAKKRALLAETYLSAGDKAKALTTIEQALKVEKEPPLFQAARIYVGAGQESKASAIATTLAGKIEPVPRAQALIIEGELQLKRGKAREAIKAFEDSLQISDLWLARYGLGRAYLAANALTEADSQFDRCFRRRGEATDVFMDEMQTFHYFPAVLYYEGLVHSGMKTPNADKYFKDYLAVKAPNASDPLVADSRKRLNP